jgi:hypothetical protein
MLQLQMRGEWCAFEGLAQRLAGFPAHATHQAAAE